MSPSPKGASPPSGIAHCSATNSGVAVDPKPIIPSPPPAETARASSAGDPGHRGPDDRGV